MSHDVAEVFIVKTNSRKSGVNSLLETFDMADFNQENIAVKANYNSADPFPASTHPETLRHLINFLKAANNAGEIVLAERSGMGETYEVLSKMNIFKLADELGFKVVVLDEEDYDSWKRIESNGNHWINGFYLSKIFTEADRVVQTCCVKTHRFGGDFSLSLKNSVGLAAKQVPGEIYNYMGELHSSPYQRHMIAEINQYYDIDLILMDGMKAFINKGPETGKVVEPNLIMASKDRIAMDSVGVALLRHYGTTRKVSSGRIFDLEQIKRASELGFGVKNVEDIEIICLNPEAEAVSEELEQILMEG